MRWSLPVAPLGISSRMTSWRGTLKCGEARRGEVAQLALGGAGAFAQHDRGGDLLAQLRRAAWRR